MPHVGDQRALPYIVVYPGADMAVEVAIGAFLQAERPMDIECARHGAFQYG
jgi:hypothetical protein